MNENVIYEKLWADSVLPIGVGVEKSFHIGYNKETEKKFSLLSFRKEEQKMSFDRLCDKILEMKNPTVAGLDPTLKYIPEEIRAACREQFSDPFEAAAESFFLFNKGLIDALCDIVPAVKPQAAYYEALGWQGVRAMERTVAYAAQKGMFVILDGKRNDIGSTMEAYSNAYLGMTDLEGEKRAAFGADALTANGYLGRDGIAPLLEACREYDKGIFVLVKTSNPSSGQLQDRLMDGDPLYLQMGRLCEEWGSEAPGSKYGYSSVGAVVGATYPQMLAELRQALPHTFFLVPGYGAQGGGAEGVRPAFDGDGLGAIVNSSRAIMTAWQKQGRPGSEFAAAARDEALRMRADLVG